MPLFPKVTSPCPYKSQLASVMDGDFCRACRRPVFDLTAMDDGARHAFLAGCEEEGICVSYRLPMHAAIAAAALAVATPAAAQDQPAPTAEAEAGYADTWETNEMVIIVGGIKPASAEMIAVEEDSAIPELPIVYDDAEAPPSRPIDRRPETR